jgi:hypothetical protein
MRGGASKASFVRFGLETALGSPEFAVLLLGALLVPWTILVATVDAAWFPVPWVRWAWVGFDCVLVLGLFSLARPWRTVLARALAVAITLDAVVTLVEVAAFDAPRASSVSAWLVLALACAAPLSAATFLWLALRRARVA